MRTRKPSASVLGIVAAALALAACGSESEATTRSGASGSLPQGGEKGRSRAGRLLDRHHNPYWPMTPGSRWVYSEKDTEGKRERVVVEVTDETKIANGIEAQVIRDTVTEKGVPVEVTDDWYAQDEAGNIWYLGEYVTNYENGKVVDHEGLVRGRRRRGPGRRRASGEPRGGNVLPAGVLQG